MFKQIHSSTLVICTNCAKAFSGNVLRNEIVKSASTRRLTFCMPCAEEISAAAGKWFKND